MQTEALTILAIEDDAAIRRGVVDALRFKGFKVLEAGHGATGLQLATTASYDLLLLDLALPGVPGMEILKAVRRLLPNQPVIILTAKGDERDRVDGLQAGADDYIVKPFSVKELLARVDAVLRRSPSRPLSGGQVAFAHGIADFDRREIRFSNEQRVELSERESELLQYLADHRGRAVSRDELLASVWRLSPQGVNTRTIDMHVARLREKLQDDAAAPQILLTVRGKGYMFQIASGAENA